MGHIVGGHQRLIDAMVARAQELGVEARTEAPVTGLATDADGAVTGVELEGETLDFDLTIPTLQPPALRFLLPRAPSGPAGALPAALARAASARSSRCRARCCPTTRSTSPSRRR